MSDETEGRWHVMTAKIGSDELVALLKLGWEPFGVFTKNPNNGDYPHVALRIRESLRARTRPEEDSDGGV